LISHFFTFFEPFLRHKCDGKDRLHKIQKLECHSIVVLNIPSFFSGVNPWNQVKKRYGPQSFNDGKLEVIGFHSADLVRYGLDFVLSSIPFRIVLTAILFFFEN
jgi:hypothetical protein